MFVKAKTIRSYGSMGAEQMQRLQANAEMQMQLINSGGRTVAYTYQTPRIT